MKNLMRHIFCLTVSIAAVAGCAKTEREIAEFVPGDGTFTVVFTSEATKTGMERVLPDGATTYQYKSFWTKGDSIGVFVRCGQSEVNNNLMSSKVKSDTLHTMKFSVSGITAPATDTRYDFYAYYPYSGLLGSDYRKVRVMLPVVQYPAHGSFDPKADVLSGYPTYRDVKAGTQAKTLDVELAFARRSSVVVLMPKVGSGLPDGVTSDSTVGEIKLTFSRPVAGVASMDIIDSTAFTLEDVGSSRTVTLKYADGSHKLGDPIWVSVAPVQQVTGLSFAFKLGDGQYLCADADWSSKPQTFKQGKVKKYDVPISDAYFSQKQEVREYYQLVDTPQDDWCGKYLIVGVNSGKYYACNQVKEGNWGKFAEVSVTDGKIACSETTAGYEFEIVPGLAAGRYSILDKQGNYLSAGDDTYNTVPSPVADNTDMIIGPGSIFRAMDGSTRQFRFNSSSSYGMKFYDAASVKPISLYRLHTALVGTGIEIEPVPEQRLEYRTLDNHSFDVSIHNFDGTPVVEADGVVVRQSSIANKFGVVYTVTYSVNDNSTSADREGYVRIKCNDVYKDVVIRQAWDHYSVRPYYRVESYSDVITGRYVILTTTSSNLTTCLPCVPDNDNPLGLVTSGFEDLGNELKIGDDSQCTFEFSGTASNMLIKTVGGKSLFNYKTNQNGPRIKNLTDPAPWTITQSATAGCFHLMDQTASRYIGLNSTPNWCALLANDIASFDTYSFRLYKMDSYPIVFNVNATDGSTAITASTGSGTVVGLGSECVDGFTSNCLYAYYKGKYGLKIGKTNAGGVFEMNIARIYGQSLEKVTVKTRPYSEYDCTLSLYINGTLVVENVVPGQDIVYDVPDGTTVASIKLSTSSKCAYVSHIILDPR